MLFREYFYLCGNYCNEFDRMIGNETVRQIDWSTDRTKFEAWENARTGYPAVDAAMR